MIINVDNEIKRRKESMESLLDALEDNIAFTRRELKKESFKGKGDNFFFEQAIKYLNEYASKLYGDYELLFYLNMIQATANGGWADESRRPKVTPSYELLLNKIRDEDES